MNSYHHGKFYFVWMLQCYSSSCYCLNIKLTNKYAQLHYDTKNRATYTSKIFWSTLHQQLKSLASAAIAAIDLIWFNIFFPVKNTALNVISAMAMTKNQIINVLLIICGYIIIYSCPIFRRNQCWIIVNWRFGSKFPWYSNQNADIFRQENVL